MSASSTSTGFSLNIAKIVKKLVIVILAGMVINLALTLGGDTRHLAAAFASFSGGYFALAILFILIPWFANTGRLLIWTRFFGSRMSFIRAFKINLLSELSAAITPSAIGTRPVKVGLLLQEKMSTGAALASVTITTIEDLVFFIVAVPVALLLSSAGELAILQDFTGKIRANLLWVVALLPALALVIFLLVQMGKRLLTRLQEGKNRRQSFLSRVFGRLIQALQEFKAAYVLISKSGKYQFLATTTLAGIQWLCRYSILTALAASLGQDVDPVLFFALQWLVFALAVLVPTPGATGGAEAAFYLIFSYFIPQSSLKLLTIGWRFMTFYFFMGLGAVLYIGVSIAERMPRELRWSKLIWSSEKI